MSYSELGAAPRRRFRERGFASRGLGLTPAAAGAAAGSFIPGVGTTIGGIIGAVTGGLFHTSAAGPNAAAANAIAPLVRSGDLTAIAAAITRSGITVQSSAAPYKQLLATVPQSLIDAANAMYPGNNWSIFGALDPTQLLGRVQQVAAQKAATTASGVVAVSPVGPGTATSSGMLSNVASGFFEGSSATGGVSPIILLGGFALLMLATRKGGRN